MHRPLKSFVWFLLAATLAWLFASPCAWAQQPQKIGSALSHAAGSDGRCKVRITADVSPALLDAIRAQGGEVLNAYPRYRAVYAMVPTARLETLAAREDVQFIGLPPRVMHHHSERATTSAVETATNDPEGDIAHGASQIRKQYTIDGTGIKVGVLSDSLDNGSGAYQSALNAGYVSAVTTVGQTVSGEGGGLAMLEIVHRLAPGAQLYFATGDVSEEGFADNIEALANAGCKIIIDDLSYSDESPFQDGIVAQAVSAVSGQGVLYFSSATDTGNKDSGKSGCWEGDFNGSSGGYLNFATGAQTNKITSSSTAGLTVTLFWSDPAGSATSVYGLVEYSPSGTSVRSATDSTGQPSQTLHNVQPGDSIAVYQVSGGARFLHLDIFEGNATFAYGTNGRTRGHNASGAANAFCVAASPASGATGGGPSGPYPGQFSSANGIETFSADGPRRVFFNANGTAITPGNFSSSGGQLLAKPDFAAADGVTTSLPAGSALNLFYGTSASAPHAGALAALLLSYDAALTPAQMGVVLRAGAVKPGSNALNANDYGVGILLAPSMVAAASAYSGGPTISGFFPTSGPVGTSVTIYGYNFTSPFSVVFNGNVAATVTSSNISQVVVTVPAGALTGPIRITNSTGGSVYTPTDFTVTTVQKPVINSAATASGQVGKAFSYTITASNTPTGYDATGLPTGLSINKNTGVISGTPTAAGTYSVTIKATNSGGTDQETLTITILPAAPVITSDLTASGKVGVAFSYQIVATNSPTSYSVLGLAAGLTAKSTTGVISGTPNKAGTFHFTIKATNAGGYDQETLTVTIAPAPPVITSSLTASGKVGVAFSYQIIATNNPTGYGAVGLKSGLHIDGNGLISGTPTAAGTFNVIIKAVNGSGNDAETLKVTILNAQPVITSAASVTGQVGVPFTYQIIATNSPTNYGAVGLKFGLTINGSNGLISGTPTAAGTFTITLKAANNGGVGTKDLTVTIKPPAAPVISAANAYGTVNAAFTYQVAATGKPTSYAVTSGLPPGLNFNTTTGVLSGTPTAAGTFAVKLSATNAYGTGTGTLTVKIAPLNSPVIVSPLTATGDVGTLFNYQIAATRNPSSYGAANLPPGLAIGTTPGLITGTPTTAGTYTVTLTASNSVGTGSALLTITIQKSGVPLITSTLTAVGSVGSAFSYQIAASNNPTGYGAGGLPAGLTISAKGLISGTPTTSGRYTVTLQATNTVGTGSATLALTIQPQGSPVIYSPSTATGTVGNTFTYTILASPDATSFTASDLPPGLSVNTSTGKITGTPTQAGTFAVALTATNASGKGSKTVTIKITSVPPSITSLKYATATVNKAFTYQITADGSPTSYDATGLPAGLSVNKTTGVISGTPTVAGEFSVTISALNSGGTGSATLDLTVQGVPVIDTNHVPATATVGQNFTYYIYASNDATSYNATGLPPGLTIDKTYGEITGKPTKAGTFTLTLSATNTAGTGTGKVTITVQSLNIPVVTAKDFGTLTTGQPVNYYIEATNNPTSYNATGLPAGLTIDKTYGEITGKPTAAGTFTVTLYATNASGTGSVQVTVVVNALQKPVVTAKDFGTAITNTSFYYYIDAANNPTSYNATGLPAGLSVDTTYGEITGKPTTAGTFTVTLSATNAAGTGTVQVTLTVQAQSPPVVSAKAANSATVGSSFYYYIDATNNPTSYNASGLPPGLTIDTGDGTISGKPTQAGNFTVTLSASNAAGTGTAQITITVQGLNPPVVDNTPPPNATVGFYFSYTITASNNPTSYAASGVPPGLSLDASGGYISGTPTTAGTYPVTISASNGAGMGSAQITITVNPN